MLSQLAKDIPTKDTEVKQQILKNAQKTQEDFDKKSKEVKKATKNLKTSIGGGISVGGVILKLFSFIAGCGVIFALVIFFRMRGGESRFDGDKKFC
jgi:hypothetical protein